MTSGTAVGSPSSLTSQDSIAQPLPPIHGGPIGNDNNDSLLRSDAPRDLFDESNGNDAPHQVNNNDTPPPHMVDGDNNPPYGSQGDIANRS